MSPDPVLLLTRPLAQSESFLEQCATRIGRAVPSVISPVLRIVPLDETPDLSGASLVVTSPNAVRILAEKLKGRDVKTVGHATAELARGYGAIAECLGVTAEALLERAADIESPIVVVRGVHARLDLASELKARGQMARAVLIYDQEEVQLTQKARSLLVGQGMVIVPVFSPRSARLLSGNTISAPIKVLAISDAVANAWQGPGEITVADQPTAQAMCELVAGVV